MLILETGLDSHSRLPQYGVQIGEARSARWMFSTAHIKAKTMSAKRKIAETSPLQGYARPQGQTLTPVGVAANLGVHRATLFKWIKAGIFPPASIRAGRVVRWSIKTVDAWIEKGVSA